MRVSLMCALCSVGGSLGFNSPATATTHWPRRHHARFSLPLASVSSVPPELLEAAWLPELEGLSSASDSAARMNEVLEWLSTMLVKLDLIEEEDEMDDEIDEDFVLTVRLGPDPFVNPTHTLSFQVLPLLA